MKESEQTACKHNGQDDNRVRSVVQEIGQHRGDKENDHDRTFELAKEQVQRPGMFLGIQALRPRALLPDDRLAVGQSPGRRLNKRQHV